MSVEATVTTGINAAETITLTGSLANQTIKVTHAGLNQSSALKSNSSPAVDSVASNSVVMVAGAATIDLTLLTGSLPGTTVDLTGKKVAAILIKAKTTNTAAITITKGATNGYTGLGAAFSVTLEPGDRFLFERKGTGVAVSASVKTLDVSGTGTEGLDFEVIGG